MENTDSRPEQAATNQPAPSQPAPGTLSWLGKPFTRRRVRFDYGQNTFFLREGDEPYRIAPRISPPARGCFSYEPAGLALDLQTGEIDVNRSHSGIRYEIAFHPHHGRFVARTHVTISGINYPSGVYRLGKASAVEPFYNARSDQRAPAGRFERQPFPDAKGADPQLVLCDRTGRIDLDATIKNGALGFAADGSGRPENGTCREFEVYYRLEDDSRRVLNFTPVRVHYYRTEQDIPKRLLRSIAQKNKWLHQVTQRGFPLALLTALPLAGFADAPGWALLSLLTALVAAAVDSEGYGGNPKDMRPPDVTVTS